METRIRHHPVILVLLAFVVSGCRGGCNGGYVPETSLQGKELKSILDEGRKVEVAAPEGWPVKFDAVAIDKKTEASATSYRAVLVWRLSGLQDTVRPQLEKMLKHHMPARELDEWEVSRIELDLKFKNDEGGAVGHQNVKLDLAKNTGKLILTELGKKGSPHAIDVEVAGCTIIERGTIPATVAGNAPLHAEPIQVTRTTSRGTSDYDGRLKWSLHPDRDAAKQALLKIVAATKPDAKLAELQQAVLEVEYTDKNGATTAEQVTVALDVAGGEATLRKLGANGLPASAKVKLVSIELAGSRVEVPAK